MKLFYILIINIIFSLTSLPANGKVLFNLGSDSTDFGKDVATDLEGNIIATGYFYGTVDFDPGTSVQNLTSKGFVDIYVAKYDDEGNYRWAFSIGGAGADMPHSIFVDGVGDIYITGYFSGTVDFDPSPSKTTNAVSKGDRDAFIAKYDYNGIFQWVKAIGSSKLDEGIDLFVDILGYVHVVGVFSGTIDLDPSDIPDAEDTFSSNGDSTDIFIAIYDELGYYQWGFAIGGPGTDYGNAIRAGFDGSIYIGGFFSGTVDFDLSEGTKTLVSSGLFDAFLAKYDFLGNLMWVNKWGSTGADQIRPGGMEIDDDDNLYVCGDFTGTSNFNPKGTANLTSKGRGDIFLAKYDENGNYLWAIGMGSDGLDAAHRVTLDEQKNVLITGWYSGSVDFDGKSGVSNLSSKGTNGAYDGFIAKYTNNGDFLWANGFGTVSSGSYYWNMGAGLACDMDGNIIITGKIFSKTDFYSQYETSSLTSKNSSDIFIAKYTPDGKLWGNDIPQPTIKLLSPNGGEKLAAGTTHNITWTSSGINLINIAISYNNGKDYTLIADSVVASSGSYAWQIKNYVSDSCKIIIYDVSNWNNNDVSDNIFSILPNPNKYVKVISPNGGEVFHAGSKQIIKWDSKNINKVNIYLNFMYVNMMIFDSVDASSKEIEWIVPQITGNNFKIIIEDISDLSYKDTSDSNFSIIIVPKSNIVITSPNGGEELEERSIHRITWDFDDVIDFDIKIYYSNDISNKLIFIANEKIQKKFYDWQVPSTISDYCKIHIMDNDGGGSVVYDSSDSYFKIIMSSDVENHITNPYNINLFPNPAINISNIGLELSSPCYVTIEIYNILGKQVSIPVKGFYNSGNYNFEINLPQIGNTPGIYLLKFTIGDKTEYRRLIFTP